MNLVSGVNAQTGHILRMKLYQFPVLPDKKWFIEGKFDGHGGVRFWVNDLTNLKILNESSVVSPFENFSRSR
jgi:hypothetical protein